MKRILTSVFAIVFSIIFMNTSEAITYTEASSSSKPMALLIYADWADDVNNMQKSFDSMSQKYGNRFNFVQMNIASEDTKTYNKRYHIYPNLPYVILYREGGKVSRYIKKDCVTSSSCFEEKLKFFLN